MSSAWLTPPPHKSSRTWWSVSWTSFKLICLSVFMQISAPWEENGTQFCCIQHYVTAWKNQRISFVQTNNIETYSRLNCIMNYEKKNYILNYILQRSYIHNRTISKSVFLQSKRLTLWGEIWHPLLLFLLYHDNLATIFFFKFIVDKKVLLRNQTVQRKLTDSYTDTGDSFNTCWINIKLQKASPY